LSKTNRSNSSGQSLTGLRSSFCDCIVKDDQISPSSVIGPTGPRGYHPSGLGRCSSGKQRKTVRDPDGQLVPVSLYGIPTFSPRGGEVSFVAGQDTDSLPANSRRTKRGPSARAAHFCHASEAGRQSVSRCSLVTDSTTRWEHLFQVLVGSPRSSRELFSEGVRKETPRPIKCC